MANTVQIFSLVIFLITGAIMAQEKINFFNSKSSSSPLVLELPKNYEKYFDEIYRRESTQQDSKIQTLSDMHMIMGIKNENFDYGTDMAGDKENLEQVKFEIAPNFLNTDEQPSTNVHENNGKYQLRDTGMSNLGPHGIRQITNQEKQIYEKRNNYYMALCHFKICNMGRKRNSRYLHL